MGMAGGGDGELRIKITLPKFFKTWGNVLALPNTGLVPITTLVEVLCAGDVVQQCFGCGDQVSVEILAVQSFGNFAAPPPNIPGPGLLVNTF